MASDTWKQSASAAQVDLAAALATTNTAALDHLRDAALNIDQAISALESEEAPEE